MGLSALNAQRFNYNITDTPVCFLCNRADETPLHFLWECRAHSVARKRMLERIVGETDVENVNEKKNIIELTILGKIGKEYLSTLFQITSEYLLTSARFR
jgi:hypothetical protein